MSDPLMFASLVAAFPEAAIIFFALVLLFTAGPYRKQGATGEHPIQFLSFEVPTIILVNPILLAFLGELRSAQVAIDHRFFRL